MEKRWKVVLYRSQSGNFPVQEFIDTLEIKAQSKVRDTINLLREYGIHLGLLQAKKLTTISLWELRILGSDSIRILYFARAGRKFVLLHGFKKKSQTIPIKELKIARDRLTDYKIRSA